MNLDGPPCALVCVMALDEICHCRCGGLNHGKQRLPFAGYFCEGCGQSFGTNARAVWRNGAYLASGRSQKYRGRFGGSSIAHWCRLCYAQRHPREAQRLDYLREAIA